MSVLLLDDDDSFRAALTDLLKDDGHSVHPCRSIAELPSLTELPALTALITDYQLGDTEDGLSFARRFHTLQPEVPVILVTACTSDHLDRAAAATPYLTLLRKSVRYEDLHEAIHRPI